MSRAYDEHAGEQAMVQGQDDLLAVTKLAPQVRDDGHISRRALLDKFDDVLRHRLTIVHAGAGYSKTSTLMQWLRAARDRNIRSAWLTLEEDEANPSVFLSHLIMALEREKHIGDGSLTDLARYDERVPLRTLVTALVNRLADNPEPLVIFLDEYNRARSDGTDSLFRLLTRQAPPHVHFVIASRLRPEIDIENLRVQGDLIEFQADDLRFSEEETAELLSQAGMRLDPAELHRLLDRTEGWPIALQMARLWLGNDSRRASMVADFSGRTSDLARYMTEQVLSELPEDQQAFLLETSILDRINGDLANAVTGRRDGWPLLELFHEKSLFLIPENDDWQWFRYHTLFLDFLRDRMERHQPHRLAELHGRAARWFGEKGMVRPAVDHALRSGDHDFAGQLVVEAGGWRLILDGRVELIRSAIGAFPGSVVDAKPGLAAAKAILMVKDGDIRGGRAYFDSLRSAFAADLSPRDRADWKICDLILADYADDHVSFEGIAHLQDLCSQIPGDDHLTQAILFDTLASTRFRYGQLAEALAACDSAAEHYRAMESPYGEVFARMGKACILIAQARLDEAEALLRQTIEDLETRFGGAVELSPQLSIYLAEVLADRGQMDEAAEWLDQALIVIEQRDGWLDLYAHAYTAAASVAWSRSGVDGTLAMLDRARSVAQSR
ncbi:MAG: AAA family ATPase, partial [Sphingomonadales bacterium]